MPALQNDFDKPYVGSMYVTPAGDLELSYPLYLFVDLEASFSVSAIRSRCRRSALACSNPSAMWLCQGPAPALQR